VAFDEEYISSGEFNFTYEMARRTRAAIRGFITYLKKYEERKANNREPWTVNAEPEQWTIEKTKYYSVSWLLASVFYFFINREPWTVNPEPEYWPFEEN